MTRRFLVAMGLTATLGWGPTASAGNPWFARVDSALPLACGGNGCWTNHLRVTDYDGDGDLDVLLANYADFFNGGSNGSEALAVYRNDGNAGFTNVSGAAVGGYEGTVRQIAVGDVDGDGDLDIYAPQGDASAHVLFVNQGDGTFVDEADLRLPEAYPAAAATRMGDVDNDGDLDIFVADAYAGGGPPYGHLYLNQGDGTFEEATGAIPDSISGQGIDDCEVLDVDRDFDLDIVVNAHSDGIGALWLNDGTGTFAAGGSLAPPATGDYHYNVAPCDVDGDGDLDLWVDNIGGGFTEQLQINDGTGNFSDETGARVSGNPGEDDNGVVCADLDNDGDFDGIVLSLATPERFLENDGTGNFTYAAGYFPTETDCTLWGELGDLDGDGRFDLVTGQGECSTGDEIDLATALLPIDDRAPTIIAVESVAPDYADEEEPVVRFAVSDRTVTDEGPRLTSAYALIDPDGAATNVDATYMGGDLFRVVLPPGAGGTTITFRVCAEDWHGNVACSDDQSYDVFGGGGTGTGGATDTGVDGTASAPTASGTSAGTGGTGTGGSTTDTDTAGAGDGGDDGCGCRRSNGAPGGLLLLLAVAARRRRSTG